MVHMYFCEKCNELTDTNVCQKCGGQTRVPNDSDLCFVCDLDDFNRSMYVDALSNNDVPFVAMPVHGGFSQMNTPNSYNIYVRYDSYVKATEILNTIFSVKENEIKNVDDPSSVIDRAVKVIVDRPKGSVHHEHPDIVYKLNYGHVEGVMGGDGEEQDAYIIGVNAPLQRLYEFYGYVIAVIVRKNDVETKWVVAPVYGGVSPYIPKFTKEQIAEAVNFQEKFFDIEIVM